VVYVSAWLKCYYPAAFAAALINSQPMGFYAPAQLVRDAREHGVEVRGVDINSSDYDCTLEPMAHTAAIDRSGGTRLDSQLALRLGLRMIRGLPVAAAETIVAARAAGPFRTLNDLARRTRLGRNVLVRLAKADALGSLRVNRRTGLWQALARPRQQTPLPLFDSLPDELAPSDVQTRLPRLSDFDEVLADYRTAGLSLRAHPISFFRTQLERLGIVRAEELPRRTPGKVVAVAGVVLVRQRPSTASGITFMTIEDETGVSNLVVRPAIWRRFRSAAANSAALVARGVLEREGEVIHILVHRIEDMTELTGRLDNRSRDFQ
jgi:error-prone DNA polymerase